MMKISQESIKSALEKEPNALGMTFFQLKHFVIGSQPTVWGSYKQCCVEIKQRQETLDSLSLRKKLLLLELEELESCNNERSKLHAEAKRNDISHIDNGVLDVERELEFLVSLAEDLKSKLPDESWEDHQPIYWMEKLWREAWASYITTGTISPSILQSAMALPTEQRDNFIKKFKQVTSPDRITIDKREQLGVDVSSVDKL